MPTTSTDRKVVTFYSFKGGVGRTMTLANVAWLLASRGLRVIVVDWDLEAPGLHKFFGLTDADLQRHKGVLDFFVDWRDAHDARKTAPPDASAWLLPILERPFAPPRGTLSLLVAARRDPHHGQRLAKFDWLELYNEREGANAVQTLRDQLTAKADLVLIDSRTGWTEIGGICTISLPDGVLLMAAPNRQSLDGLREAADSIWASEPNQRGNRRARPHVWVAVCRVVQSEEFELTREWFERENAWFVAGARDGRWRIENLPQHDRQFRIPHSSRWSFDEHLLLRPETGEWDGEDRLAAAYVTLAEYLFQWSQGARSQPQRASHEELEQRVASAEEQGDAEASSHALYELGRARLLAGEHEDALTALERAAGIDFASGEHQSHALTLIAIGDVRFEQGRLNDARANYEKALALLRGSASSGAGSREEADSGKAALALIALGRLDGRQGRLTEARRQFDAAVKLAHEAGNGKVEAQAHYQIGKVLEAEGHFNEALASHERVLELSRESGDLNGEAASMRASGELLTQLRELDRAEDLLREALELTRERGDDDRGLVRTLRSLGKVLVDKAQWPAARDLYDAAEKIARQMGDEAEEANVRDDIQLLERSAETARRVRMQPEEDADPS